MAVTITDLAEASGVNASTVSRALNGAYGVNPATREHVLALAKRLGYRPNRVARGLATGRSHTLGLIVGDIRNPFFAEVARGAEDAAQRAGSDLILCNSDLKVEKQMHYVDSLMEKRVDGMIMSSVATLDRAQQEYLASASVPIVLLYRSQSNAGFSTVSSDHEHGGSLAAQHLLALGHHHIAHLTGPRERGGLAARAMSFVRVLQSAPAPVDPLIYHGSRNAVGAYEMTRQLLAEHPEVTAIFAANDAMAFGAVRAIFEAGLRIPEDLSLIGYDNVEMSSIIHPPLTTIHQPKYEMGEAAVEILIRMGKIGGSKVPEHRVFGTSLVERRSTAPPRTLA